jgi:pimeloyl-ACP methyl ester carboxylesterase
MHLSWPTEVRRQANFNLYALDLPGHGKSDAAGGLQTIDAYADRVLDWMQAVGLSRRFVIQHGGPLPLLAFSTRGICLGQWLQVYLQVNPDSSRQRHDFYKVVGLLVPGRPEPERLVVWPGSVWRCKVECFI